MMRSFFFRRTDWQSVLLVGRIANPSYLVVVTALVLVGPVHAQRDLTRIPDPDPEIERRSFQVADGFEVNLFAADPLLAKPIQMNFDPAGRLWVACSEVYPQIKPGQKANDKIIILEDTQGKGRADKVTVFADGLLIPTGVEPGDGGAYVADSTDLVHLKDTDGDGKADQRHVVLSGFGTEDTHHILHTLRWGPEGLLYFNQSIYIHSHIETPHGVRRLLGGGIWQFRPETLELEVIARGFVNPWGHHFDRWGQSFATDGAYGEGINYLVPGASYVAAVGASRILSGLNPGSPKHCGLEILSGRHLPPDWRGNFLTNDFRGHRVCRFVLREDGSGYASREQSELIKTTHAAFRPVDIKIGPDGAIYIADWYNPIIQHGEVDFRDPRRDHTHGRIWRVTAKGRPLVPRPRLAGATTEALLEALKAPEDWTRHQAKRVLKERGRSILPALAAWVKHLDPADPDVEHQRLEALWVYQALDVVEPDLLQALLHAREAHARAAAVRVLSAWHARLPHALGRLAERVSDPHPQVRLEAVRALGRIHERQAVEVALRVLDQPMDRFLDYGLWLTVRDLVPSWMPAFQKGELTFGGQAERMLFALRAAGSRAALRPLVDMLRAGKLPHDREVEILALIADTGGPEELGQVFDIALAAKPADHDRQIHLLNALERAARQNKPRPAGNLQRLGSLFAANDDDLRAAAIRLAGLWKVESLRPQVLEQAQAAATRDTIRQAAIEALALFGGPADKRALEQLAGKDRPIKVRALAVVNLTTIDPEAAARQAAALFRAGVDTSVAAQVFEAFLQRRNGADVLARALAKQKIPADVAKIGVRVVRASGRPAPALVKVLADAGAATPGPRVLAPAEMRQLVTEVLQKGDPARGEAVFRRKDLTCLKCHAIAGAGGQVGPDLASIGASAPVDYLVESILEPSKAIKEGYHTVVVATREGKVVTGIKVRETKTDLILRDAEDREIAVPLKSIEETANGRSLMPEGLADLLTHAELVDLVRFLSELGKVGPYAVGKAPVVRRWQVLEPTRPAYQQLASVGFGAMAAANPALTWSPAYSQVAGTLPLDAIPAFKLKKGFSEEFTTTGFVRFQVEVSTGGKFKLLNSAAGLTAWVDGVPVEVRPEMVLDLKPGLHTVTMAIDLAKRRESLRCTLEDYPGSPARGRVVGGK
jgi:putative heme-binding domain-containing protein